MAVSLAHLPLWLWGGGGKRKGGKGIDPVPNGSSSTEWGLGLRDLDNVRFPLVKGSKMASPSTRKMKRKWKSREERRRIGNDSDVVLVPSDGGCLSGSESDDSDWSIGWLEPHAPDFQNDDEADNSFAVLVPCYRHAEIKELEPRSDNHHHHHQLQHQFLDGINFLNTEYTDGKKHVEDWISSLQSY
ncbi:uncharacterized protein LOC124914511 [Impatiens glandulifera]|uniref:uncharacterized protein LOC124914511 n=1 Tax=Impatiens glandulifera TaxID=253017 RepID=UPI001FB19BD0|nr:uncharacterized protein LOC124914511 [Impatiens glandulifera]